MQRIKRQATGSYTFESLYYDDDGVHHTVHAPVSLTIRDGAGAVIHTATPTVHSGHLDITIAVSVLPHLDTYEFTWTATLDSATVTWVEEIELVGGYLFEISDLRAFDRQFADAGKWPAEKLRRARTWVENTIEGDRAAQVAFVPRGRRVVLSGNGPDPLNGYIDLTYVQDYRTLIAPDFELRDVYAVSINDVPFTTDEVADVRVDDNVLWHSSGLVWPKGRRNIAVHYEHGYDRPPGAVTRAALLLAREYLIQSDLPGRATATSIGDQMFRLTIAGRDGVTGIPDVDAAIDQFGRKGYGIG